jgi:hypothetical protein
MNSNLIDNVIAGLFSTGLWVVVGVLLSTLGLSTPVSAVLALLAAIFLFILFKIFYPRYIQWLTKKLLENTFKIKDDDTDKTRVAFKQEIIDRVYQETPINTSHPGIMRTNELEQLISSFKEFANQKQCEPELQAAFRSAKVVKILTIRGQKYFVGMKGKSLFYDILKDRSTKNFNVEILALISESAHITLELAKEQFEHSPGYMRHKMRGIRDTLKEIASQQDNFQVRYYDEEPIFKMLMFDDVMFITAYIGPKNDDNAPMFQITREGNPLFSGFEKYFDELWKRSASP